MRLLLDEMFDPEVAVQLRGRGHEVVAVKERDDLERLPDPELFRAAQAERRAVVTENIPDFIRLDRAYRQEGAIHHGVILTNPHRFPRRAPRGVSLLVSALDALLHTREDWPQGESPIHWLR